MQLQLKLPKPKIEDIQFYFQESGLLKNLRNAVVYVMGSLGRGEADNGSDIDLIICSPDFQYHKYECLIWNGYLIDQNCMSLETLKDFAEDPDWENMVAESSVLIDHDGQGVKFRDCLRGKQRDGKHRILQCSVLLKDAKKLLGICDLNKNEIAVKPVLIDVGYFGITSLCAFINLTRGSYSDHFQKAENAFDKLGCKELYRQYEELHSPPDFSPETMISLTKELIHSINHHLAKLKLEGGVPESKEFKAFVVVHRALYLKQNNKIKPAIFVFRRMIMSLLLPYCLKLSRGYYKKNRLNSAEVIIVQECIDRNVLHLIDNIFAGVEYAGFKNWLNSLIRGVNVND
ncbi:MAG: hypothetical protein GY739_14280 [Mesoflavibacter sp.]|nr:hypothetical protein [Mesoflavibacter sp.]